MKRALAVMGAVVMILVAVLIRSVINDNSNGSKNGGNSADGPVRILCSTELKEICSSLTEENLASVDVADPGATVDTLTAGTSADFDAWLTVGPWDRVFEDNLDFARPSPGEPKISNPFGSDGQILARSPVVFVSINTPATDKVAAVCGAEPAVSCASTDPSLSIGIPSTRRGDGLVGLAQATAGRLGKADFDANDLDDPDLSSWIALLANKSRSAKLGTSNALTVAVTRTGQFQAVVAIEADTVTSANRLDLAKVTYPKPLMTADVHLIPRAPARSSDSSEGKVREIPEDMVNRIKELLAESGWRVDGKVPAGTSGPALPSGDGLPEPGVLQVLRKSWGKGG